MTNPENPEFLSSPELPAEHLEWEIPSDVIMVTDYMEKLDTVVKKHWPEFDFETNQIAVGFNEALANAIKHGNKFNLDKKVVVTLDINKDELNIAVLDEGEGFNHTKQSDPTLENHLLIPSGRGRLFISTFFDEVKYNEKGNEIRLKKLRHNKEEQKQP